MGVTPLVERYADRLPLARDAPVVCLGEGSTPLLPAPRIGSELGTELLLKWEAANPTGSFKDRGMTVAISQAVADRAGGVVCASTGNTAASAAAYAARAGLECVIFYPTGAVAAGKLAQARVVGATIAGRPSFESALDDARELASQGTHVLVNSLNPLRVEGQKTAAFEIVDDLGAPPDLVALPYGGGGNLRAYALGFAEQGAARPRLLAGEAADRGGTLASAIRIAEPAHAQEAEWAVAQSGGAVVAVDDEAILAAWRRLAREEGLFCEPSAAAGLAALLAEPPRGARVVCVITGHGLKDVAAVEADGAG